LTTIETTSTAAIARRDVNPTTAKAAKQFVDFLTHLLGSQSLSSMGFDQPTIN
jgi:ABC-type molybdate transport system substrate-binding protein